MAAPGHLPKKRMSDDLIDALLGGWDEPSDGGLQAATSAHVEEPAASPPSSAVDLVAVPLELWNPHVAWSPPSASSQLLAAKARYRLPAAPSAAAELGRQAAVQTVQKAFSRLCEHAGVGWDKAIVNQHFERWMFDRQLADRLASLNRPGGAPDPLLPSAMAAANDPGLRKALFKTGELPGPSHWALPPPSLHRPPPRRRRPILLHLLCTRLLCAPCCIVLLAPIPYTPTLSVLAYRSSCADSTSGGQWQGRLRQQPSGSLWRR